MKVLNPRSALLSDFEVLEFLKEASAEEHSRPKSDRHQDSAALQNLRTVHFEVRKILRSLYLLPTSRWIGARQGFTKERKSLNFKRKGSSFSSLSSWKAVFHLHSCEIDSVHPLIRKRHLHHQKPGPTGDLDKSWLCLSFSFLSRLFTFLFHHDPFFPFRTPNR